jgi:hypothetical protein
MGIGDKTDPTTDFFDTHRAQCVEIAALLRGVTGADAILAKLDESIALCDTAIANGGQRADMPASVATLAAIVTRYTALPAKVQTDLAAALRAKIATKAGS